MPMGFFEKPPEGYRLALLVQTDQMYGSYRLTVTVVGINDQEEIRNNAGALDGFGFRALEYRDAARGPELMCWGQEDDLCYLDVGTVNGPKARMMSEVLTRVGQSMARKIRDDGPAESVGQYAQRIGTIIGAEYIIRHKPGTSMANRYDAMQWDIWPAKATSALVNEELQRTFDTEKAVA